MSRLALARYDIAHNKASALVGSMSSLMAMTNLPAARCSTAAPYIARLTSVVGMSRSQTMAMTLRMLVSGSCIDTFLMPLMPSVLRRKLRNKGSMPISLIRLDLLGAGAHPAMKARGGGDKGGGATNRPGRSIERGLKARGRQVQQPAAIPLHLFADVRFERIARRPARRQFRARRR